LAGGKTGESLFFELALEDITGASDLFRPIFDRTAGRDGWVSLEVSPALAFNPVRGCPGTDPGEICASARSRQQWRGFAESFHRRSQRKSGPRPLAVAGSADPIWPRRRGRAACASNIKTPRNESLAGPRRPNLKRLRRGAFPTGCFYVVKTDYVRGRGIALR